MHHFAAFCQSHSDFAGDTVCGDKVKGQDGAALHFFFRLMFGCRASFFVLIEYLWRLWRFCQSGFWCSYIFFLFWISFTTLHQAFRPLLFRMVVSCALSIHTVFYMFKCVCMCVSVHPSIVILFGYAQWCCRVLLVPSSSTHWMCDLHVVRQ